MKKLFTYALIIVATISFAQAPPVIEGTYMPVRNTKIKQVWDVTPGSMSVPSIGTNQVWDYRFTNNQFLNVVDTFDFGFYDPSATPYAQYFPGATHATFVRTPFDNFSDSLYYYWEINHEGLYNLGGFNIRSKYDSTIVNDQKDFFAPSTISYQDVMTDTIFSTIFANNISGYKAKIRERKIKTLDYVAYGTLLLPNGSYNNVGLVRETSSILDSVFVDILNNGNYTFFTIETSSSIIYQFLRNNTFGSAFLMYLSANPSNTQISYGWYTLPTDFGSISGIVYTDDSEAIAVTDGELYLYRENSNFTKNDILAKTTLDGNGYYEFDSIPYGEYRIAVRPNLNTYPNSLITYVGDTTNWIAANTIITTTTTSTGHIIHLKYHPAPVGSNGIVGNLMYNSLVSKSASVLSTKPVPGVGIVVKKNPGSSERNVITDANGDYNLGNLDDGAYKLFVDIPGLHMAGTYEFTVSGGNVVNSLDYTVGNDSIHPYSSSPIGLIELKDKSSTYIMAYPNPYNTNATIELNLTETNAVTIEAYNVLGEKIATIDSGNKNAGNYKYSFSAKNLGYSSGMYFVKLTAGKTTKVLKLIEQQ